MEKIRKSLSLIALTVFIGSNLLTPVSYAIDDLEGVIELSQVSENAPENLGSESAFQGGGEQGLNNEKIPLVDDVFSLGEEKMIDDKIKDSLIESSKGQDEPQDDNGETSEGGLGSGNFSVIDSLKGLISNVTENLTQETEKSEIEIAWETLNINPIEKSEKYNNVTVNVKSDEGVFPEGTNLYIGAIKGHALENIRQQISEDSTNDVDEDSEIVAFDIKFLYKLSDGSEIEVQPKEGESVQVTFDYSKNKELKVADNDENKGIEIYHINDKDENGEKVAEGDEVVEKIEINQEKSEEIDNALVIDAESFSVYTIVLQRSKEIDENTQSPKTWKYGTDYYTISIVKPEGLDVEGPAGFTIMDRNLGAETVGYGPEATTGSYGYYYQWGNNYGFDYSVNSDDILASKLAIWDENYNHNGYNGNKFIKGDIFWNDELPHNGLWGGEDDGTDNNRGANQSNSEDRQGPCPEGWHVPSEGEWGLLLKYWAFGSGHDNYLEDAGSGLYYMNGKSIAVDFWNYFKLPFAGYRLNNSAVVLNKSYDGRYRSSSSLGRYFLLEYRSASYNTAPLYNISSKYTANRNSGLSVRCFKNNYEESNSYTLDFDSQNGSTVTGQMALEGETWVKPLNPIRAGYVFDGWYTDTSYQTAFDFSTIVVADATAYAKWIKCEENYLGVCSYYDVNNNVYYGVDLNHKYNGNQIGTITVNLDGGDSITMMDMNLGATTNDYMSTGSYGYHYQRGNNYGFEQLYNNVSGDAIVDSASSTAAKYKNYWPGNRYENSLFRYSMKDYWNTTKIGSKNFENFDVLWGGLGDGASNNRGGIHNGAIRQGPCPAGYHIPSIMEWNTVLQYFAGNVNQSLTESGGLHYFSNTTNVGKFQKIFKLPFAGHRIRSNNAMLYNQGEFGYYWSSSPYSTGSNNARDIYFDSSYVTMDSHNSRAFGRSVRCFKDSNVAPEINILKFDADGGTLLGADDNGILEQQVAGQHLAQQPVNPTKKNYKFKQWLDENYNTFDFSSAVTKSQTLIAEWEQMASNVDWEKDVCTEATVIEECGSVMEQYGFGYGYGYGFGCGEENWNSCSYGFGYGYGCVDNEDNKLPDTEDKLICGDSIEEYGFGYGYGYGFGCGEENWNSCSYGFGYGYGCVDEKNHFNAVVAAEGSCGTSDVETCEDGILLSGSNKKMNCFKFEEITIGKYTIMDRNLGATSNDISDPASYGYYYQWGNNYGFNMLKNKGNILAKWDSAYNHSNYTNPVFRIGNDDYWENEEHYNDLWGGANDANYENRQNWDDGGDRYLRQGPCPEGWHVPSIGEWNMLIKYWGTENGSVGGDELYGDGLYYLTNKHSDFQEDINLPFAGYRENYEGVLKKHGSIGYYWSSSSSSNDYYNEYYDPVSAFSLLIDIDSKRVTDEFMYRADGIPVRCFKDSNVDPESYTLTFDTLSGTEVTSQTVIEGSIRSKPATNPTKTNWIFDNWYTSMGYERVFDFSIPASENTTVYAKWNDGKAPSNVTISTTSNEKTTFQTATLSCTDEIGVTKYYWGTSSSPADNLYTSVTSNTGFSITQPVSSAGTYYLFCKDAAGNTSTSATKTYYTYSVQNMLDKVSGTQGTYNTTNYETGEDSMGTYIIPSGTSITLNNSTSYGDPISGHDTYAGYTTANSGTPTNSNPIIIDHTTYYRWFNRDSHTLTLNKGTGVISISGAGTYKHGASISIETTSNTSAGYSFSSWTVNNGNNPASTTNASTTVTITQNTTLTANASDTTAPTIEINAQPSTSCAINKTVKAIITDGVGVDLSEYAIVSSSTCDSSIESTATWENYTSASNIPLDSENLNNKYVCFRASDTAGNTSYLATNQITNIDTAGPGVPTLSTPANNTYTNNNKPTLTWTAGSIAGCSAFANYEIQICSDSSCNTVEQLNTSATSTTWTPTTALSDGIYYWRVRGKDSLNRYSDYTDTKSFTVDTLAPTIIITQPNATEWTTSKTVSATVSDGTIYYSINTDGTCTSATTEYTAGNAMIFNTESDNGKYVCYKAVDAVGNETYERSAKIEKIDTTAPVLSGKSVFNDGWYITNQTSIFTYVDTGAGISQGANITQCEINQEGSSRMCEVTDTYVCDILGNCNTDPQISNPIKLDKTQPVCGTWTYQPTTQTNGDVTATLAGSTDATSGIKTAGGTCSLASNDATCSVIIEDNAGFTRVCTSQSVNNIDKVKPDATVQAETSTLKSGSQTAKLICSDNVGVTNYYWGTSSNPAPTDYQDITLQTNFETSKTVNAAGTYYLFCKDEAGNISDSVSKTYYSYEVHNMLNAVDKAEGIYNTANYGESSTAVYIVPAGTMITFANVYTVPNHSLASQYKGYTTSNSGIPSLNSSVIINSNTSYYFWFDRTKYDLNLVRNNGIGTIYYKVNGANSYSNTSDSKLILIKAGSDIYLYAVANSGYEYTQTSVTNPQIFISVTESKIFSPITSLEEYSIQYNNVEGSDNAEKNSITGFTVETLTIPLNDIIKDDYIFSGWYTDPQFVLGSQISEITQGTHENIVLYAKWLKDFNHNGLDDNIESHFNIVFSGGQTGVLSGKLEYENVLVGLTFQEAGIVVPEILPRVGYISKGWNPKKPESLDIISNDMTYSVIWKVDTNNNGIADEEEIKPSGGNSSGGGGRGKKMSISENHNSAAEKPIEKMAEEKVIQEDDKRKELDLNTDNNSKSQGQDNSTFSDSSYTQEQMEAYIFAKSNRITTTSSIEEAMMNKTLTRIQMAKMLSYYAINVLGKTPDTTKRIKFRDISSKLDKQYDNGVTLAYQLGIMGQNMKNNEFRPNDEVSRDECVTALSRMLYGIKDGSGNSKYYEPHMKKLYNEGIISNTDPKMKEMRGYVMIMLMRSAYGK